MHRAPARLGRADGQARTADGGHQIAGSAGQLGQDGPLPGKISCLLQLTILLDPFCFCSAAPPRAASRPRALTAAREVPDLRIATTADLAPSARPPVWVPLLPLPAPRSRPWRKPATRSASAPTGPKPTSTPPAPKTAASPNISPRPPTRKLPRKPPTRRHHVPVWRTARRERLPRGHLAQRHRRTAPSTGHRRRCLLEILHELFDGHRVPEDEYHGCRDHDERGDVADRQRYIWDAGEYPAREPGDAARGFPCGSTAGLPSESKAWTCTARLNA